MDEQRRRYDTAMQIGERLREKREELGYTPKELAEYLHERWDVNFYTAINYIREKLEFALLFTQSKKGDVPSHLEKIADYLAALGVKKREARRILKGVKDVFPDFELVDSDVKKYEPHPKPKPVRPKIYTLRDICRDIAVIKRENTEAYKRIEELVKEEVKKSS